MGSNIICTFQITKRSTEQALEDVSSCSQLAFSQSSLPVNYRCLYKGVSTIFKNAALINLVKKSDKKSGRKTTLRSPQEWQDLLIQPLVSYDFILSTGKTGTLTQKLHFVNLSRDHVLMRTFWKAMKTMIKMHSQTMVSFHSITL